jgi:hypothetical protein
MTWWTAILPVLTLMLGAAGNEWTSGRRDTRAAQLLKESRDVDGATKLRDRRDTFELDALTRTITALGDLGRASARAHHQDSMIAKQSGKYASHLLGEDVSEQLMLATRAMHDVEGLILDDTIRQAVIYAHAAILAPSSRLESDPDEASRMFSAGAQELFDAQEIVSERIREIYANEAA